MQKFGGAALKNLDSISKVASYISEQHLLGASILVVVSAMGQTTDELSKMAKSFGSQPPKRELDMLLSSGERISMSLLCMALASNGCPAVSYTGSQAGILTNSSHSQAKIVAIHASRISKSLATKNVVVVAGFQGVHPGTKEITTLGRGGSDTTAVAMAIHFKAKRCELYKDVGGVFSGDPHCVEASFLISYLPYDVLAEICFWGGKIIQYRAVELAWRNSLPLFLPSVATPNKGTFIQNQPPTGVPEMFENEAMASVTSHPCVSRYISKSSSIDCATSKLDKIFAANSMPWPQILSASLEPENGVEIWFAESASQTNEIGNLLKDALPTDASFESQFSTVTVVCYGSYRSSLLKVLTNELAQNSILIHKILTAPMSLTFIILQKDQVQSQIILHNLLVKHQAPNTI